MNPIRAFTLIELLIAMAILAMLGGMLMTMLNVAQRQAKITNTKSILMKVDQAIRLFRNDMRVYPWQTDLTDADTDPSKWTNNLAERLAWKPSDADRSAYMAGYQQDLTRLHEAFVYRTGDTIGGYASDVFTGDGTHAFRTPNNESNKTLTTNLLMKTGTVGKPVSSITMNYIPRKTKEAQQAGQVLTRLAEEITALTYLSGRMPVEAPRGVDPKDAADQAAFPALDSRFDQMVSMPSGYPYVPYNRATTYGDDRRGPVLDTSTAQANGWRGEYLADALRRRPAAQNGEIDATGTVILDTWGRPLIYVCTVVPGAHGYRHALDNIGGAVNELYYNLGPSSGRSETTAFASDIRTTAAKPFVPEFELWSAGPDGLFSAQRSDLGNRDNVSLLAYTKGLQ
jgi:prepilin-type N-terminal cleavage/methylation domain-containing protein